MTASVHLAGDGRGVDELVCLVYVECVHVGAQPYCFPRCAGAQHAHHAGLREPAMNLDAEGCELLRNDVGGTHFLECRFGMPVKVVPPFRHVLVERSDAIDDGHGGILLG